MIKTIIWAAALFVLIAFIADMKISFKPFYVKFGSPFFAIGVVLIGLGLACYYYEAYKQGREHGINEVMSIINQQKEKK
jgi:hypothetical protein